jgi:gamma-glutamyltranspeptidase/glutathione hydrolase
MLSQGFVLNNQLTDFSASAILRAHPNARPEANGRSSMAPTMVFDGKGRLGWSSSVRGGSRIIGYVTTKSLIGVLIGTWTQDAIALPNRVEMARSGIGSTSL